MRHIFWPLYPPNSVPGLHFAQILLAVKQDFIFPPGVQRVFYIPSDIPRSLGDLNAGRAPADFGFQLFRTLTPPRNGAYTVGTYFLMPRGELAPSAERIAAIEDYFFSHVDRLLPGLERAIVYKRFLSPADFAHFHETSSALMPLMAPPEWKRPPHYDPATGIYYTRPAIHPPNYTGEAVLSGVLAALWAARALSGPR